MAMHESRLAAGHDRPQDLNKLLLRQVSLVSGAVLRALSLMSDCWGNILYQPSMGATSQASSSAPVWRRPGLRVSLPAE
jgi:hypothetical protein